MLLSLYFNPLLGDVSLPLLMLVSNAVSVALLNWIVMVWVNKLLSKWLSPAKPSVALDVAGALGILALLVGMYFIFTIINPSAS